jgi:hypothetical protein
LITSIGKSPAGKYYDLHRFDSRTSAWSRDVVPLVAPQAACWKSSPMITHSLTPDGGGR